MKKLVNKRILALVLSIIMVLGIMPVAAFAQTQTPAMFYDANANGTYEEGTDRIVTDLKEELQKEQDGTVIVTSGEYVLDEWGIEYLTALDVESSATVTIKDGWFYKDVSCGIYTESGTLDLIRFTDGMANSLNIYGKAVIQRVDLINGGSVGENADLTIYGGYYSGEAYETFLRSGEYLAEGFEVYYAEELGFYVVRPAGITDVEIFRDWDNDGAGIYESAWGDVPFRTLEEGLRYENGDVLVIGGEHVVRDGVYENILRVLNGKVTFDGGTFTGYLYLHPGAGRTDQAAEAVINGGTFAQEFRALNNTKLTVNGGIFNELIILTASNETTITGGIFKGPIDVNNNAKVTVTGGVFEGQIWYSGGMIDLSGYADPTGITVVNCCGDFIPGGDTVLLPEGYVFYDAEGNEADTLLEEQIYTVGKELAVTDYPLWVGGVQFTSENLVIDSTDDAGITGGKATYDPQTNTLTLDNFTYSSQGRMWEDDSVISAIFYNNAASELKVELVGTNTVTHTPGEELPYSFGFFSVVSLSFSGTGSLTVTGGDAESFSSGICVYTGDLTVTDSSTVNARGGTAAISIGIWVVGELLENPEFEAADDEATNVLDNESGTNTVVGNTDARVMQAESTTDDTDADRVGGSLTVSGNGSLTAIGGEVSSEGAESYGIYAETVTVSGGVTVAQGMTRSFWNAPGVTDYDNTKVWYGNTAEAAAAAGAKELSDLEESYMECYVKISPTRTVTLEAGNGIDAATTVVVCVGDYILPECGFAAPDGKEFTGWDLGQPGDVITVSESITLTAQWNDIAPPTGDSSHLALWAALLFISGAAVIAMTAANGKRKYRVAK